MKKILVFLALFLVTSLILPQSFAQVSSTPEIKVGKKQSPQCYGVSVSPTPDKKMSISGKYSGSVGSIVLITNDVGATLFKKKSGVMYGSLSFDNIRIPDDSKSIFFCVGRGSSEPVRGSFTYQISMK